jgi:hypothetical protein
MGWLSPDQHGFREAKSTETAGHSLITHIENGFVEKKVSACAFLDINSAFDSAWHPAIISALVKRSCPLYLVKIIHSYLTNRKAMLSIQGVAILKTINLGCPQGGVLSPFLWTILVDDLLRLQFPFPFKLIAYADDLTVVTSHKDPTVATRNLQLACDTISAWLHGIKLKLNASKTVFLIFSKRRLNLPTLQLVINGMGIFPSQEASFLGLIIDSHLKWASHIKTKCLAAKRALFSVHNCIRLNWGYDVKRLRFLLSTTVEPIITYGCAIWSSALSKKTNVKLLRSAQRMAAIIINKSFKTISTESLLVMSNLLPID